MPVESRQLTEEGNGKSVKVQNKSKNKNKTKLEPIPIRGRKRKLLQIESQPMENDQSQQEVNSNYLNQKKDKLNKKDRTFNDKNASTGLYDCQLCGEGAPTIKKMAEHCQEQHAGETYQCLEEGCPFKTVSYHLLRVHYNNKTKKPVKTKNKNSNINTTTSSLEIVEENDDHSIKKKVKGFACPYDRCSFAIEVKDLDLEEKESLATLYQHEGEVHDTPIEERCHTLLFHDIREGEIEEQEEN